MTEQVKETVELVETEAKVPKTPRTKKVVETAKAVDIIQNNVSEVSVPELGVYALNEDSEIPTYGTTHSACFDIKVNLEGVYDRTTGIGVVNGMIPSNQNLQVKVEQDTDGRLYISMRPHSRVLAPTGVILDIPVGYSVKVHPRSGTSYKQGINLINQEGVIDADYVEELFLPLVNTSDNHVKIYHGERYAQGELQVVEQTTFKLLKERPKHKSERVGGFGHTGV